MMIIIIIISFTLILDEFLRVHTQKRARSAASEARVPSGLKKKQRGRRKANCLLCTLFTASQKEKKK